LNFSTQRNDWRSCSATFPDRSVHNNCRWGGVRSGIALAEGVWSDQRRAMFARHHAHTLAWLRANPWPFVDGKVLLRLQTPLRLAGNSIARFSTGLPRASRVVRFAK
jgi:hypothetical protein